MAMFFRGLATRGSSVAAAEAPALRSATTALVPYVKAPSALVRSGHKFVEPTPDQHSGMRAGSASDTVIPKGTKLYQSQAPGGYQGSWYTRKPVSPWGVGISPVGITTVREHGPGGAGLPPLQLPDGAGVMHQEGGVATRLTRKSTYAYEAMADVPAVRSVAAVIKDTWSMGALGMSAMTGGGEEQLLIPQRAKMRPEPKGLTKHEFRPSSTRSFPELD